MKKYSLTTNTKVWCGITLFQIKAEISFGSVVKGELGGYIEKEENLSQVYGNAWVYGNARVYGNAQVYGDAQVSGDARVYGNARVSGDAWVYGNAQVYGDARVSGNAQVYGNARVSGDAWVSAKLEYKKGWFIGGDDSGKITDITDKTGTTYWKNQYVLGDYEIVSQGNDDKKKELLDKADELIKQAQSLKDKAQEL